ncbi:MAG: UDP-N-acetylmuramate dehydrogenase [Candidatus Spechtbacterales bacterium]
MQKDIKLAPYTTYKIGGPAKYFAECKSEKDILYALKWAKEKELPYFVLGGGSNLLVSDGGYKGLVIHIFNAGILQDGMEIEAGAGTTMEDLVDLSVKNGMKGLEWAGGLPGQLGGALRGNAGAFGGEIKDIVKSVRVVSADGEIKDFTKAQCNFTYRTSVFKENPGDIIVSAKLNLKKGNADELRQVADGHMEWRRTKHPIEYGNSGSVFKGVELEKLPAMAVKEYPDFKRAIRDGRVAAAFFIDRAGLKLKRIGGAEVSGKHPNFLINRTGSARAEDVIILKSIVKSRVMCELGAALEEEIEFLD